MSEQEYYDLELDQHTGSKAGTLKRLVAYAMQFKGLLAIALLMLAVAVGTDLAGPLVAKRLIDVHIAGIEQPWHTVAEGDKYTVQYGGSNYKRADKFKAGEQRGEPSSIVQVGKTFYFVAEPVMEGGTKAVDSATGTLTITKGDESASYAAQKLAPAELMAFYRPEIGGMIQLCLFYFGLIVISAFFSYGQRYYLQSSANRIILQMRRDVFAQINRLPMRYFDNLPAGKVVSRITNDTEAIRELYVNVLANFFTGILYMGGIFIALFLLNLRLGLICLFIIPLLGLWVYVYGKLARVYNRKIRATVSEINGMINETIQGMPIIRAFRKEKQVEQEFHTHNDRLFHLHNRLLNLNSLTGHNLVGVIRNLALVAMIAYFGGISLNSGSGAITLGILYAFVDYLNRLFNPIVNIVNQLPILETAVVSAERVFVLLDEQGEDVREEQIPRIEGNVAFKQVSFAYKEGEDVLRGLNFEAAKGQTVALVGHTGSGKSSILNLLFRFYDVREGAITIDGVDIRTIPRQAMRRHMGIVLQDPFLFTGTIGSNISLNDPDISRERVERALADVGGERVFQHFPQGLDTPVIEKGSTLSAGQRQLISFARALAFNPAILILDEATSNIDTETEALIQQALEVVKQGRTTFVIAHRLSTIKDADLILVLDRGEIVERGNHDSLMRQNGKYFQMYQLQLGELDAVPHG